MRVSRTALLATTLLSGVTLAGPAFGQTTTNPAATQPNPQAQPEVNSGTPHQTPATQDNPAQAVGVTPPPTPAAQQETIVVTGSRISSPNITSLAPIQVI